MKTLPLLVTLAALTLHPSRGAADDLDRRLIAADARWVLHLDAAAFQKSRLGNAFIEKILDPKTAQAKTDLKRELGFELDWRQLQSLTAYGVNLKPLGTPDPSAVLLVKSTLNFRAAFDAAITKNLPGLSVRREESSTAPLYSLNDSAWVGFEPGGRMLLAKDREAIQQAMAVLAGKTPNLASSDALSGYPAANTPLLLVAVAEGFAQQTDLPPKAAILKQAQGARLTIAEQGSDIRLGLNIRANSADVARQVQEIGQGLLALALLNGNQDPNLQQLVKTVTLNTDGPMVGVTASIPVADVMVRLEANP